jgi:DNA polymerase III delta prime subunit
MNRHIPWVEKYRPSEFNDVVLDTLNKRIMENIINTSSFPHLLFYGPPGTGKTTTVVNLIRAYQIKHSSENNDLVIHLNASDDRGIDVIRNQINIFVNSKPLFRKGLKFVILDEVDYMTKSAQQALCCLLQQNNELVRYCLICNYISKIDIGLQREFVRLRFNQLPVDCIHSFLRKVCDSENVIIDDTALLNIQTLYQSDIRSMINFIQSNGGAINVINEQVWSNLFERILSKNCNIAASLTDIRIKHNVNIKQTVNYFIKFIIRNKPLYVTATFLRFVENLIHSINTTNTETYLQYASSRLQSSLTHLDIIHTDTCGRCL